MTYDALDDFAGPGGWDTGAAMVGLTTLGIEWDMAACQTAKAAGHARIRADVAAYPSEPFAGIPGYIASPPCQAWSMAGKRKGEYDRASCHVLADRMAAGDDSTEWTEWEDERSPLVCQPVRRVRELRPEWVALEEVPAVLGLWEHFGRIFRGWGYSVWVGVLNAADYGVPQTRQRVILMASRVRQAAPPVPTHSRFADEGDLFGASRLGWVSMAAALGWDLGPEHVVRTGQLSYKHGRTDADLQEYVRPVDRPSPTVSGQAGAYWTVAHESEPRREHNGKRARAWYDDRPATTVVGSFCPDVVAAPGSVRITAPEGGVLQSFPADYPWQGSRTTQYQQIGNAICPRLAAHVLAALTGKSLEPTP